MKNWRSSFFLALAILLFQSASLAPQTSDETYFERKTNERQPPQKVMDAIGVKPGMVIGEVGAGEGRYTVHLARRVGKTGKVYANDINAKSLEHLRKRCQKNGLENVEIIQGKVDDPLFPKGALDLSFMILTYHHLAKPVDLLRNLIPSLKAGAVVAIADPDPIKDRGRDPDEVTSVEKMRKEAGEAGFEVVRVETFLEKDNIFILRVKPARDDRNASLDGTKVRASAEKGQELTNAGRSGPRVTKSGYIEVDKAKLYYEEQGQGVPLVMIHGGGLDRRNWDDQFDILAQDHRVIRYDARQHGKSQAEPAVFSHHEDLNRLLDGLGIPRAAIMGLSMGGYVAIDFALAHPDKVIALIPVSPGLTGYDFKDKECLENEKKANEAKTLDEAIEYVMRSWTDGPRRTPDQVASAVRERARQMYKGNYQNWRPGSREVRLQPPAIGRLTEIQVPTLVIVGDLDMPGILEIADMIVKNVRGAKKAVIKGAAHLVNMEKAQEFNQIVLDFLD